MTLAQPLNSHPLGFLSTHNALAEIVDGGENELVNLRISELSKDTTPVIRASVYPFYDVELLKRLIIFRSHLPATTNISEIRVFFRGTELPNHRSLLCFAETKAKLHFHWSLRDASKSIGIRCLNLKPPPHLQTLLADVNIGLLRGMAPKLTMDGTGGTYFLSDSVGYRMALFKPKDEEAFAPNNPRMYEGHFGQKGFRPGAYSGEGAAREVAAYLFDSQHGGHAGVPATTKVEARHPSFCHKVIIRGSTFQRKTPRTPQTFWKEGSFQECINSHGTCGDYDPGVFAVSDVHHIGILDIALLNLDRNDGNLLVVQRPSSLTDNSLTIDNKPSRFRLVPIDHGLILPDTMDVGDIDLVWYEWPQSKIEFGEAALQYLLSFDEKKDVQRLRRKLDIRENCLRSMRITIRLLQMGVKEKLTLKQIASLLVRTADFQQPSVVEKAVHTALAQAYMIVNYSSLVSQAHLGNENTVMDLHLGNDKSRLRSMNKFTKSNSSLTNKLEEQITNQSESDDSDQASDDEMTSRFFCRPTDKKKRNGSRDSSNGAESPHEDKDLSSMGQSQVLNDFNHKDSTKISPTFKSRKPLNQANDLDAARGTTATRRLATALRSNTWTLLNKNGHPIPLNWENPYFEKTLFDCFEFAMQTVIHDIFFGLLKSPPGSSVSHLY